MPASRCARVTVAANASVWWQAAQFAFTFSLFATLNPTAWQEVQEPPEGPRATAGVRAKSLRACGAETGRRSKLILYPTADAAESAPITMTAQVKTARGQGRTRSLVGVQLNRALPRRGGDCGCRGDGRPAFS